MAKAMVEVLVDDLDGSEGAETVRLGWNGDWHELELSTKNLASLSKALDKYWDAGRVVSVDGQVESPEAAEDNPAVGARLGPSHATPG